MAKLGDIFVKQIVGEWGNECNNERNGVFVLRTTNFTNSGVINYDKVVKRDIPDTKVEEKKLKYGDIILEKSGGTDKTPVGRVVFCDNKIESDVYLCNNFTQAMRVDNSIAIPKYVFYLMYYFHQIGITDLLQSKTTGIRNLRLRDYLNTDIKLPNLAEQEHCVIYLDKLTVLISLRQQQLEKLDELVKSRFIEMFGDCKDTIALNDLCSIITDGTHQPPKFQKEGIPFIFVSNLSDNKVTYKTEKFISEETYNQLYERTPIQYGDILLSTVGSYGHPAVVVDKRKFLFQRHIAYLKPKSDLVNSFFLHSAILAPDGQRQIEERVKGIAQKTLNLSEIRKIRIPIPSIEEQNAFEDFIKQTDKSKVAVQASITKCHYLTKKGVNTHA